MIEIFLISLVCFWVEECNGQFSLFFAESPIAKRFPVVDMAPKSHEFSQLEFFLLNGQESLARLEKMP